MLRRIFTHLLFLACLCFGMISSAYASDSDADILKQPKHHLIMRHAIAPGTGDPDDFNLDDCSTQRNLSEEGRLQAQSIGEVIKSLNIHIDEVYSSQWCRCDDTAALLDLGDVLPLPALNSIWMAPEDIKNQHTKEFLEFLKNYPDDKTAMFVTHFANIRALTDYPVSQGDVMIIKITDDGMEIVKAIALPQ